MRDALMILGFFLAGWLSVQLHRRWRNRRAIRRSLDKVSLKLLAIWDPDEPVCEGYTVEDVERITKNRIWQKRGLQHLRVIEAEIESELEASE